MAAVVAVAAVVVFAAAPPAVVVAVVVESKSVGLWPVSGLIGTYRAQSAAFQ